MAGVRQRHQQVPVNQRGVLVKDCLYSRIANPRVRDWIIYHLGRETVAKGEVGCQSL